ncbi:hypothetical protein G7K_1448-t1 [Saitoella complicata NRRL Y-17804]|uniref:Enoyl-CoA hydratase n=1 Tax=Saitoella complicata (strain BCRC 22490 / CBS 7301 / JCM 7358 / NBRC 10748 / NRRL Y-17804) TaxID=698492 RepID=A0A0E9NBQ7_SAICN|nr:hypothetical protein G7K_1448-t1 [Saitoella complicata NRRL Y-17804]
MLLDLPKSPYALLSLPQPQTLLVTLSRPHALNSLPSAAHHDLASIFAWYDAEPSLRCCIITGAGDKAFCAGADLKEWLEQVEGGVRRVMPPEGFGGLSRRRGKKPVVAAVNGVAMGGGMEMLANCDIVIAAQHATFALPEVKRGVIALAGALPRLTHTLGLHHTSLLALTGRTLPADSPLLRPLIAQIVPASKLLPTALGIAKEICGNSPDSVIVTRMGIRSAWEAGGVEEGTEKVMRGEAYGRLVEGENHREGLRAFKEKRRVRWVDSKL